MTSEFNPDRSMFGKHSYLNEQAILRNVQGHASKGLFVIDPHLIKINFPLVSLMSVERRRNLAKKHFENAIISLNKMGVK